VLPPASRIGPITPDERRAVLTGSIVSGVYEQAVDRESAFERLRERAARGPGPEHVESIPGTPAPAPGREAVTASGSVLGGLAGVLFGTTGPRGGRREGLLDAMARSASRSMGSTLGRQVMRGMLGSLLGGTGRRG
jgi:hypothetical protein